MKDELLFHPVRDREEDPVLGGYMELAAAIVLQALRDYKYVSRIRPDAKVRYCAVQTGKTAAQERADIEAFFVSGYYGRLGFRTPGPELLALFMQANTKWRKRATK